MMITEVKHPFGLTFAQIAQLDPLAYDETTQLGYLIQMLNERIAEHVEFGEYPFSVLAPHVGTQLIGQHRWLTMSAVRGGSEGYYIHLWRMPYHHDREPGTLLSLAKTWTWESALAIAAIGSKILHDGRI